MSLKMVTINIGRKEMIFFSVILLVFILAGFGVAQWDATKSFFHSGTDVKVTISGANYSLQEAIDGGLLGGGGGGSVGSLSCTTKSTVPADHDTFYTLTCDAGYVLTGTSIFCDNGGPSSFDIAAGAVYVINGNSAKGMCTDTQDSNDWHFFYITCCKIV